MAHTSAARLLMPRKPRPSPCFPHLHLSQEDFRNFWDACPWQEDLEYARQVWGALLGACVLRLALVSVMDTRLSCARASSSRSAARSCRNLGLAKPAGSLQHELVPSLQACT